MKGLISSLKQLAKLSPIALSKNHLYDKQTQRIIRGVLKADSCCVDVGCHKGEILDLMLQAAPEGIHYGFEPIPQFYNELVKKYAGHPNVLIQNVAASNVKETSEFNFVSSNPSYSGLKKRKYDRADEVDEQIEVIVDRIDDVIPKDLKIDLIKIDVEGAELLVLKGAIELIKRCKPVIVFEHGLGAADVYGTTPGEVFDVLNDAELSISTMGAYLAGRAPLTKIEFERQYNDKVNYYFIAS